MKFAVLTKKGVNLAILIFHLNLPTQKNNGIILTCEHLIV